MNLYYYPFYITLKTIRKVERFENYKNTIHTKVAFISLSVVIKILMRKIFKDFFFEKSLSLEFRTLISFRHYKDKDFILIYKIFREKFLLKMNFIILRIIFRKYLHISKILLFAHTLFIIKNFYQISTH